MSGNVPTELMQVDMIASGYEWVCPECETYNREIGITEQIRCAKCNQEFEVKEAHHAYN